MHRHTRHGLLVLIAAAVSTAGVGSAFAATGWSPPTPLPSGDATTSPAVAVNSAGAAVQGWTQANSGGSVVVETASSPDGHPTR